METPVHKRNIAKARILNYMMTKGSTSKVELAKELNLSMPTVLSNVKELTETGIILEVGELESTGGRKARSITIDKNYRYAAGVDITANHVRMVLINLRGEVVRQERSRIVFAPNMDYYNSLSGLIGDFLKEEKEKQKILGVGFSLPGIIRSEDRILVKSHALKLENYSLKMIEQISLFPVHFENDANAAMLAEIPLQSENAIYLSLKNTLGGAICMNKSLYPGQNKKAGEFGHMILVPGGKKCYCGKEGCADAYCAASVLTDHGKITLEEFMERIGRDEEAHRVWEEYLEKLAILISNLRMAYDADIILGGDVGGFLSAYSMELGEKIFRYNLFDGDLSYLKFGTYNKEAAAVGVAKHFFAEFVEKV